MARLQGKLTWAFLTRLDTKFTPCWRVNIVLDKEEAKKAKEMGLRVTRTDDLKDPISAALGPYQVKITRYEEKRGKLRGQKNEPPTLIDVDNEPITEIVGNGSEAIVGFRLYEWNNNFGKGISADLEKVKILTLVPYVPPTEEKTETVEKEIVSDEKDDF
jgi:hypothetical protein